MPSPKASTQKARSWPPTAAAWAAPRSDTVAAPRAGVAQARAMSRTATDRASQTRIPSITDDDAPALRTLRVPALSSLLRRCEAEERSFARQCVLGVDEVV